LDRVQQLLKEREEEVRQLSAALEHYRQELGRATGLITAIENSASWKAAQRVRSLLDLLMPREGRLGRLNHYARRALNIWLDQGFEAVVAKSWAKGRAILAARRGSWSTLLSSEDRSQFPAAAASPDPSIRLVCDEPNLAIRPSVFGTVEVKGWALSADGIERVEVFLGAHPLGTATYGGLRPDVGQAYPSPEAERSGFRFAWDTRSTPDGIHELTVRAISKTGHLATTKGAVRVDNATPRREPYHVWLDLHETPALVEAGRLSAGLSYRPTISLIMPVYNAEPRYLERAIQSVRAQMYKEWELCICDDGSTRTDVWQTVEIAAQRDRRIKTKHLPTNQGIAAASQEALALATGEFTGLLDQDDELRPHALYEVAKLLNDHPDADLVYSDEDKIDPLGRRYEPFFKPDWSPDLLRACNYICHFAVLRTAVLREVGGFRQGYEGSQDYDLFLRITERTPRVRHIAKVLYHWRSLPSSTAASPAAKPDASNAARRALEEHLKRTGVDGLVQPGNAPGRWRIKYAISPQVAVSIIIPTGGHVRLLEECLATLVDKTRFRSFEIILVDNSKSDAVERFAKSLTSRFQAARYLDYRGRPFNFSLLNNQAASLATSPLLLFLNDDCVPVNPDWLEAMVEHAQRPEVGAVGAKLLYPDGTIQHAGVVLGVFENSGHAFKYLSGNERDPVYFDFPHIVRNCSAVTAACLMTRREVFQEVGGFDEVNLAVAFQDVDLCLKIRERGYLVVYTPHARLVHQEAKTKAEKVPNPYEVRHMKEKWASVIARDPFYSPNLTRTREDFGLDLPR
jgi:GT2 family glycosyltransferase